MKQLSRVLIVVLFSTSLFSCDVFSSKEDEPVEEWEPIPSEVLAEVRVIYQRLIDEAETRDATDKFYRTYQQLDIVVQDSLLWQGNEICGFGSVQANDNPQIMIAYNEGCWDITEFDKEIVVFHELGHAILARGHRDDVLPDGTRASIMYSGNIRSLYSEVRQNRRQYYVDELFDRNTPVPEWAQ